jgi:hypothetical protein
MEADAFAEVKDPGEGIWLLPAGGEPGGYAVAIILADEGIEDETADALGHGVGADAGVEVGGGVFDGHDDGSGVGRATGMGAATTGEDGEGE